MNAAVFTRLKEIIHQQSGISIQDGKQAMVSSRINRRLRDLRLESGGDYLKHLEKNLDQEIVELLDVISTNVTRFMREPEHFVQVRNLVDEWLAGRQDCFRFWSAGCSTGEEPVSLAMILSEAARARRPRPDMKILATDISTRVLAKARESIYEAQSLEPVSAVHRERYFQKAGKAGPGHFRSRAELRDLILYKRLNLSRPPFPMKGPFDIIMCRNVMIYFDNTVRRGLIHEFHRLLRPGGYLMIGHCESLTECADLFERDEPAVYRKR